MRYVLIDRIQELVPGQNIVTIKNLSLAEEYLADHFPGFPVMPGVLMLEAMTQSAAWLVRATEDFKHSTILLKSAKMIKYGSFVEPGRQLHIHVELAGPITDPSNIPMKGKGVIDGQVMVQGRFSLVCSNLKEKDPKLANTDAALIEHLRDLYSTLLMGAVASKAMSREASGVS
jgi:3-hydroxyacyl-[acyl-carrier-protein] dehydratase